jgi:hypothetical protein
VLRFKLKSWLVCVCVLQICVVCALLLPTLLCAFFVIFIVRARDSKIVEIPRKREDTLKQKDRGIQVDHWIT